VSRWRRLVKAAELVVDRVLLGPSINGPHPNTPRIPFRPMWDERRLDHFHVIDDDGDVTPPFPGGQTK
jgi:hypothetical protein